MRIRKFKTYTLGYTVSRVVKWWQEKHPEVKHVQVGYGVHGICIAIWWVGGTNKKPRDCREMVHLVVVSGDPGNVIGIFERALKLDPPLK